MRLRKLALAGVVLWLVVWGFNRLAAPSIPAPHSPERRAILEALSGALERKLGRPVAFEAHRLRLQNGWAFVLGRPRGLAPREIAVLLHDENGRFRVVAWSLDAADEAYDQWDQKYGAPTAILHPE